MEPVRSVPHAAAAEPIETPRPMRVADRALTPRSVLDPAVSVDLSEAAGRGPEPVELRRYERDAETQALVYRVSDPVSGDVIVQIPDAMILKARAYSRQLEAAAGERVEKRA